MKMQAVKIILVFCLVGFLGGCASPAVEKYRHDPAGDYPINKTRSVPLGFDQAWDQAVHALSATVYTINNIAKESKIINVAFRLNDPVKYIDCGISHRVITYKNKPREFQYPIAGNGEYETLWTTDRGYHIWSEVKRTSTLTGVANIYFTPIDASHTSITVNINYRLKTDLKGKNYSYRNSGEYLFEGNASDSLEHELTTNTPTQFGDDSDIICKSKQVLEDQLLTILAGG